MENLDERPGQEIVTRRAVGFEVGFVVYGFFTRLVSDRQKKPRSGIGAFFPLSALSPQFQKSQ
jgi:hypothetical protein